MKTWTVTQDVLEASDGQSRFSVTADQIYSSVIEHVPVWDDLPTGKHGAAAELEFSRYPVEMAVVLYSSRSNKLPNISFEVCTQDGHRFVISKEAVLCGHVVHEGKWYPGLADNSQAILSALDKTSAGLNFGALETLNDCLVLKKIAAEGGPVIDRLSDQSLKKLLFHGSESAKPTGILTSLYPYQIHGWRWLRFIISEQLGGFLADEMGLGKTLQVISALHGHDQKKHLDSSLVIAPGSLLENWMREFEKFCPAISTLKHHGPMRTGRPTDLEHYDVVVTSYETVVRDLSLMKMIEWAVVILDEAQNIRNPDAIRTQSIKQLRRKVSLAVTGTPVENKLRDLWSIMDFILPGYLGTLNEFETRYADSMEAANALEPLVSPLMLRRHVAEVAADLPDRIDFLEVLEMRQDEAEAYEDLRNAIFEKYSIAPNLVSIGKLRQFCAHPAIVDEAIEGKMNHEFTKFERLNDLLEEIFIRGEKVLVFTSYTAMADRIANSVMSGFGVVAETFDGRLAVSRRQFVIDQFNSYSGSAALVLNPRAGGSGLNITAANHVIHYNPEWNPALEDQASARAYRRGQDHPVTIRRLIYAETVEDTMNKRLQRKRGISETAVIGVDGRDEDHSDIVAALEKSPLAKASNGM